MNVTLDPDGLPGTEQEKLLHDIGQWMSINGEAIFFSLTIQFPVVFQVTFTTTLLILFVKMVDTRCKMVSFEITRFISINPEKIYKWQIDHTFTRSVFYSPAQTVRGLIKHGIRKRRNKSFANVPSEMADKE